MKSVFIIPMMTLSLVLYATPAQSAGGSEGEQAFVKNCALCHPGKNIINAARTLSQKNLAARGIRNAADIVANMRNPGPGMTQFDEKAIPDGTARAIADYILKTFR